MFENSDDTTRTQPQLLPNITGNEIHCGILGHKAKAKKSISDGSQENFQKQTPKDS